MSLLKEAQDLQGVLQKHRRYIHQNAEQHLDLPRTSAYVEEELKKMGYIPKRLGTSGILAMAGGRKPGKVFLLRADMDALPILEESDVDFKCTTGSMHACGHDFHSAMLLGAAQLLKNHEAEIVGSVKLMFQPAEETLFGCQMMIDEGVLEAPKVDAALMMHVMSGMPIPQGTVLILNPDASMAAADWFRVNVQGKGSHGAIPDNGVDPLNVLAHIHLAYQGINAREVSPADTIALTVGQMHGGNTSNVIPDTAMMSGTLRTTDDKVREFAKKRMLEISTGIGAALRAEVEVVFEGGCPNFHIDHTLNSQMMEFATELIGAEHVLDTSKIPAVSKVMASEDFACISTRVPTTCVNLIAGSSEEGHIYPLHHPRVTFSEDALPVGAAVYTQCALRWLEVNK